MERIKLYDRTQSKDEYGAFITTWVDKGFFQADVTQLTGFRLMKFQQMGINYPISIEMRELDFIPAKILWNGKEIIIRSVVPDGRSRTTLIEGMLNESSVLPTTTISPTTLPPTTNG